MTAAALIEELTHLGVSLTLKVTGCATGGLRL